MVKLIEEFVSNPSYTLGLGGFLSLIKRIDVPMHCRSNRLYYIGTFFICWFTRHSSIPFTYSN